jgi:mono/diheme cytochrome c family protein
MWKKVLLILLLVIVFVAGGAVSYLYLHQPAQVAAASLKVPMTPERIERGRFLFNNVADCAGCHSERDYSKVGGPLVPSGQGRGNVLSDLVKGLPGTVVAANITPDPETGIGKWSDGEKIRAIRDGVDNTGRALFPMMPYPGYRNMSDEDVQAIVAYMDSLPPIHNALPVTKLDFPVGLFIKFVPQPAGSVAPPSHADRAKYGEYLVNLGGCHDCHTPLEKGQPLAGKTLAGGRIFDSKFGKVVSANITPDLETGIGKWSEEYFQKKIYDYKDYALNGPPPMAGPQAFTLMPWLAFSQWPPEDLSAVYAFLRTAKAVHNPVETHPKQ